MNESFIDEITPGKNRVVRAGDSHVVQIAQSGDLTVVGVFNPTRKGPDCGEVHLFRVASAGTWVPYRAFKAIPSHRRMSIYWTEVFFTTAEYDGVEKPVLCIRRARHRNSQQDDSELKSLLVLI